MSRTRIWIRQGHRLLVIAAATAVFPSGAKALDLTLQPADQPTRVDSFHELETKYIFGFTSGADIGVPGERAIELENTSAFQKRRGRSSAVEQEIEFEGVPTDYFQYELSAHASAHSISGTQGFDALSRVGFSGLSTDLRFAILHRGPESPIGLTVEVEPEYERIDGASGVFSSNYSASFALLADTEIIPNRLYGAINLSYTPEIGKADVDRLYQRSSELGVSSALAYRILPKVTVGGELQYYRDYDSLLLHDFAGHALFAGPTLHIQFDSKTLLAVAFSTQVAGQAAGDQHALDLDNFERYRTNVKFEVEF